MTAILTLLVIVGGVWLGGRVHGSEFSPSDFSIREFHFYEVPLLHTQITPIKRTTRTLGFPRYLVAQSLIDSSKSDPPVWHLASIGRGGTAPEDADAGLLVDQFNLTIDGKEFWRTWSDDHPKIAAVLWPVIQDLAYEELYVLVPDVLEEALKQTPPPMFRDALKERVKLEINRLVEYLKLSDNDTLADALENKLNSEWFKELGQPVKQEAEVSQ
ncbi:MAG: hypothetical protein AAF664_13350 [Planctomycetota bacterium]